MRLVSNAGTDRVVDLVRAGLKEGNRAAMATPGFSVFAYEGLRDVLGGAAVSMRMALGREAGAELVGMEADRGRRNQMRGPWLARECARWLRNGAEARIAPGTLAQAVILAGGVGVSGDCGLTTAGLGLGPGEMFGLVQASEGEEETARLWQWFEGLWRKLPPGCGELLEGLDRIGAAQPPGFIYPLVLHHLLGGGPGIDEERLANPATGIRDTQVWRKLFRFQRDGVYGALDKLDRLGGCIIADSVGLGKTFEALAIIKTYELRNLRVLVLCPKRLRDNWTLYRANDQRNVLAADQFRYDVLNHTDLSRAHGMSGDMDLAHVNWGNYDLVVIDESHNFRNKPSGERTRYDRLMRDVIQNGLKTRVLMLSATPVNNRLTDLKNQIAFITAGDDRALLQHGIPSLERTIREAQGRFHKWLGLEDKERTSARLREMLGFDYFALLDLLTIARSRRHIERYYGTGETGKFPERLRPINFKPEVDREGAFRPIREINNEIRKLHLAVYAPLKYLLEPKKADYDAKYATKVPGGATLFRQVDREESLVHLLRVNTLKRMESAVSSFALTVGRQLADVEAALAKLDANDVEMEEVNIEDVDVDDPRFEPLLVGRKVKVLLRDLDLARWGQELREDRDRLRTLAGAAEQVTAARDAKLEALRGVIAGKIERPLNADNRKVLVFTAFADTARYLYEQLAAWLASRFGLQTGLVTGSGRNQTSIQGLRNDLGSILSSFAPRAKERPAVLAGEPEIDLLIATDCISEGQNLQDCDTLVNYDIHWNPVRIIQRFGRIDRIGSANRAVQLVNFWPNLELDEYINLERRVGGKMKLLDISATGEENIIEERAEDADAMNDLEYRRKQLLRLQDAVIDLEDLGSGVSITDLSLADNRLDLAEYKKARPGELESRPLGAFAVAAAGGDGSAGEELEPGIVFLLRAEGEAAAKLARAGGDYPLAPHFLVHVGDDGVVRVPHTQVKTGLELLRRVGTGERAEGASRAAATFAKATRDGEDMQGPSALLAAAVASIAGRGEERALASLFQPGGTHALPGEFAGANDFEVLAYVVVQRV